MAKLTMETNVGGKRMNTWVAHTSAVREEIEVHTAIIGEHARGIKRRWRDTGASYVETETAKLDGYVILNDERGIKGAMAMEYGSDPHKGFPDGTPAQAILHEAAGIPMKESHPRSRRRKKLYRWRKPRRRR